MTRSLVLALVLLGCSEAHTPPATDAGSIGDGAMPVGDAGPPLTECRSLALYNHTAEMYGCDPAPHCPMCSVLLNRAIDCASLELALEPCS